MRKRDLGTNPALALTGAEVVVPVAKTSPSHLWGAGPEGKEAPQSVG